MKMIFTVHAKERMLLRGITDKMVKVALLRPDKAGIGYDGRNLVFKKFEKGIIKIVFINKKSSRVIISVIWELIKK